MNEEMLKRIGTLFISTLAMASIQPALAEEPCAAVSALGEDCGTLIVKFDLSGCGESAGAKVPKVECSGDGASAVLTTSRFVYRASLVRADHWGQSKWTASNLSRTPVKRKEKAATDSNPLATHAEAAPAAATPPAPKAAEQSPAQPVAASTPLQVSGLFDFYYAFQGGHPRAVSQNGSELNAGNIYGRFYDCYHNAFGVSLLELTMKKSVSDVSFVADLDFGPTADLNATSFATSSTTGTSTIDEVSKNIGQAYVSWTPAGTPWLTVDIGKMATHVGYEVVKARDNWQYSRSMTFSFGMPVWHSGMHVGAAVVPGRVSAGLYVYNGWNSIYDVNPGKTFGAQLKYTPSDSLTIYYNGIGGPEQAKSVSSIRTVHEMNIVYAYNPNISVAIETLTGQETHVLADSTNATWKGVTAHAKFQVSPKWWLSPRLETFSDPDGYSSGPYLLGGISRRSVTGLTLTNGFQLATGLEGRLEGRYDRSTLADFGSTDNPSDTQFTTGLALLYSF